MVFVYERYGLQGIGLNLSEAEECASEWMVRVKALEEVNTTTKACIFRIDHTVATPVLYGALAPVFYTRCPF